MLIIAEKEKLENAVKNLNSIRAKQNHKLSVIF